MQKRAHEGYILSSHFMVNSVLPTSQSKTHFFISQLLENKDQNSLTVHNIKSVY